MDLSKIMKNLKNILTCTMPDSPLRLGVPMHGSSLASGVPAYLHPAKFFSMDLLTLDD